MDKDEDTADDPMGGFLLLPEWYIPKVCNVGAVCWFASTSVDSHVCACLQAYEEVARHTRERIPTRWGRFGHGLGRPDDDLYQLYPNRGRDAQGTITMGVDNPDLERLINDVKRALPAAAQRDPICNPSLRDVDSIGTESVHPYEQQQQPRDVDEADTQGGAAPLDEKDKGGSGAGAGAGAGDGDGDGEGAGETKGDSDGEDDAAADNVELPATPMTSLGRLLGHNQVAKPGDGASSGHTGFTPGGGLVVPHDLHHTHGHRDGAPGYGGDGSGNDSEGESTGSEPLPSPLPPLALSPQRHNTVDEVFTLATRGDPYVVLTQPRHTCL